MNVLRKSSVESKATLLIGLRGSGKTTLGTVLAKRWGVRFVDLDQEVLRDLGHQTVADAWRAEGEPAFRAAESAALARALAKETGIIAAGGGTPTAPGASESILQASKAGRLRTIYLRCSPASLRSRLAKSGFENRPSLTGDDPLAEIDAVWAARDPLYCQLADLIIEEAESVESAIARIESFGSTQ